LSGDPTPDPDDERIDRLFGELVRRLRDGDDVERRDESS